MNRAQMDQILRLRRGGASYAEIADSLRISRNTIASFCRRNECGNHGDKPATPDLCKSCLTPLHHTPGKRCKTFCSDKCRQRWWNAQRQVIRHDA